MVYLSKKFKEFLRFLQVLSILSFVMILNCQKVSLLETSQIIKSKFSDPPGEYSDGPLWVWNDRLTETEIKNSLRELREQGIRQVWVHPRPGLMTPYLGDEWFEMWKISLDEAEKLDMNVWIYDENSYPSGFAGGLVPEEMPESRGLGLYFSETTRLDSLEKNYIAVYRMIAGHYENITDRVLGGESVPGGEFLIASLREAPTSGWFGGKYYVDLLKSGVTDKFIQITMENYRNRFGEQFGKRIPGWFTDEPHLRPAGGIHWSEQFPQNFKNRWGYDILDFLPSLVQPVGDWKKIRFHFQKFLLEEFIQHWAKPCYQYCEKYNLEFTGHYWEHGWPGVTHGPDNMAMSAWQQRPGIDILMNEYREDVHAQFGNIRAVKEIASIANQLGRKRTFCETYGAGGWDLRFEDMKRIGDWIYVLGVNTLNEHLTYLTLRGARKRDHPQSFSYHEPWWEAYHKISHYFTRLSLVLSAGNQINHVLLLEPTTTAWMYQPDNSGEEQLKNIGDSFQNMVNILEKSQIEYDLGCEQVIETEGEIAIENSKVWFVIGNQKYDTILLPPLMENLNLVTMELLEEFIESGGIVFCCGVPPTRINGEPSNRGIVLAKSNRWKTVSIEETVKLLLEKDSGDFTIYKNENDQGILFHHRRQLVDGEILFLVNTSIDFYSSGKIKTAAGSCEKWDPETGKISAFPFNFENNQLSFEYYLPPSGSLLLFLSKEKKKPMEITRPEITTIYPLESPDIKPVEPNVLTLDYVDISVDGETKKNIYFFEAQQFIFQKYGLEGNPWHRAVQFRDELISIQFPESSGFEASYVFSIKNRIPHNIWMVIERPDIYKVNCNGKVVEAEAGEWWLDRSFGKIDLSNVVSLGENRLTLIASPMTIYHELEPAYLLGDFSLEAAKKGFVVRESKPLQLNRNQGNPTMNKDSAQRYGWNEQGYPFYSAGVAYREEFEIPEKSDRYFVVLSNWYGSVAKIEVNGKICGYIGYPPWECEVTEWIRQGKNEITVTVIGTLKNTLGPFHFGKIVGRAWPDMFTTAPVIGPPAGNDYFTVGYGLFEPFLIKHEKP